MSIVGRPQHGVRSPAAFGLSRLQRRRVVAAAAFGLALMAAVLAGIWAGRHVAPAASPPPDQVRQVSAGHGRLTVPATWRPATLGAAGLPGLTPATSAALSVRADVRAWAVAMITPADHASLVPHPLRRLLRGPLPPPRQTRLGGRAAWLYTGLTTRAGRALELTVQPTTAGVLAVACVAPASARPAESLCGGAITSAAVRGATTLVPAPSVALALRLEPRLQALEGSRERMRASLSRAGSQETQARLARGLAGAHLSEADALAPLAATAGAPLVHALRKVGSAYADLATAAARGSRAAFTAAGKDVDAADAQLADAVGSVRRRIAPEPAPPLPRAAASPSPLLLLLAIASLAAALALVHGRRAWDRREGSREGSARHAPARQSRHRSSAARPGRPPRPGRAQRVPPRARNPHSVPAAPAAATPPAPRSKQPVAPPAVPSNGRPASPTSRPARPQADPPVPAQTPASPAAPSSVQPSAAFVEQTGDGGAGAPAVAAPAHSGTGWTCEIDWRAGLRAATFRATAAQPSGDAREIARSSPLQWPPLIPPLPEPDLEAALLELEQRLVLAGWTPIKPVRPEWFRRRFAWTKAKPPRPLPSTPGPDSGWTCEIAWKAGLRGAGFHARATASGERTQLVVARSPKLEWPPLLDPSPIDELVAAAAGIERALIASGWKPAGRGAAWYALRFAWTSESPPVAASATSPAALTGWPALRRGARSSTADRERGRS